MKYIKHIFSEHFPKVVAIFGVLVVLIFYSFIYASAADAPLPFTLNPGHPWNETGDGNIQFTGTTALRTFTLPDASATLLTTAATTADIAPSTNKNYVTDAHLIILGNTSGTNTGDNAVNSLYSGLATSKQDTLVSGGNIRTINGNSLLGGTDLVIAGGDVTGPASAVNNDFVFFDTTTGKLIKDSGLNSSSFLTSLSGAVLTDQSSLQTIGATGARLAKLWASDLTSTIGSFDTSVMSPVLIGGSGTTSNLILQSTSGVGTSSSLIKFLTGNNGAIENARMGILNVAVGGAATGGTITTSGSYTIHTFTTSGTFTPNGAMNVEVLAVAGGGGGGARSGAGGGGGGYQYNSSFPVTAQAYSVTVGAGGAGGGTGGMGSTGNDSIFSTITANGGGAGGNSSNNGGNGGSGGGGGGAGGTGGIGNQGSNGGNNLGGGGGAGGAGGDGSSGTGGVGVVNPIVGSTTGQNIAGTYYLAGGGAAGNMPSGGGSGGGGNSSTNGTANTGGGGGGWDGSATAGDGGSGVVIIRYLTSATQDVPVFGIGQTSPTALLHLGAGTANASTAPLKFTAGTNLTTPEAGAMEWDGSNLFITQTSGAVRKTIAYTSDITSGGGLLLDQTSPQTVINGTPTFSSGINLGAGTATVAPLTLTSGTLLTTSAPGSIEFNNDNYYASISTPIVSGITSQYPPAQNDTYVKATSSFAAAGTYPYTATDPAKSLTGAINNNGWLADAGTITNQRFHIDLGSAKVITRFYYENGIDGGSIPNAGVQNFTLWGSNNAGAFADLTYGDDTNWTQLSTSQPTFDEHTASDIIDPKYITVTNSTAYQYYAFKFADNWGNGTYFGVRRIELQETVQNYRKGIVLTDGTNLVSGRIPFATTNGRLIDAAGLLFDGSNIQIGGNAVRGTTAGTNQLIIYDGTAPAGTLANGGSIFSATGELHVMDAAGNNTQISPHDPVTNFWVYDSVNLGLGKSLKIDMEEIMKALNAEFGLDYVHECLDNGSGGCLPNTNMDPTIADKFTTSIKGTLGKLGLFVEDGIATVKEMYADKLTSKQLCLTGNDGETVCIDKNQLKNVFGASVVAPTPPPVTPPPTPPADTVPPVVSLVGADPLNLVIGDTFTDPGATALDDIDGNITANISAINNVDTSTAGIYTITYTVKDVAGNAGTATRNVIVN